MAFTMRQMLDMGTSFYHSSGIEIITKKKGGSKYYLVMLSEHEVIASNLDVIPISNTIPSHAKFNTIDKAFAVLDTYIATKDE